ncbi:hypothetical protein HME9304_02786 [Flagellimonas maritima]|uniref:Uncharacterized protein n=1 Tax=Flagellimonas maritima TaxID=1383885 RepID=A0A2Z4LVA3_9FLAO|nr:hypothetical protein HME9304_02786 [Allomuricauda aurantiaca]
MIIKKPEIFIWLYIEPVSTSRTNFAPDFENGTLKQFQVNDKNVLF